jgi:polar amino acid transport system substrate-binding protein
MNAVAARLGVEVRWQDTGGFDNIIPGLKSGRYDVALSNINATKKRLEQVDFVSYYDASRLGVISRKDANIAPFTSFNAVCGQEVGAGAGTTQIGRLEAASKICTDAGNRRSRLPSSRIALQAYRPWSAVAYRCSSARMKV